MISYYRFPTKIEGLEALAEHFPEWDGVQTPHDFNGLTLVVSTEPVELDEQGEPLPSTWVGFHVDIISNAAPGILEEFQIHPSSPSHTPL